MEHDLVPAIMELTEAVRALTRAYASSSAPRRTSVPASAKKPPAPVGEQFNATIIKQLFTWKNGQGRTYRAKTDTPIDFGNDITSSDIKLFVSDKHMVAFDADDRVSFGISKSEVSEYNGYTQYSIFVSNITPNSPVAPAPESVDEDITVEGNNTEQDDSIPF